MAQGLADNVELAELLRRCLRNSLRLACGHRGPGNGIKQRETGPGFRHPWGIRRALRQTGEGFSGWGEKLFIGEGGGGADRRKRRSRRKKKGRGNEGREQKGDEEGEGKEEEEEAEMKDDPGRVLAASSKLCTASHVRKVQECRQASVSNATVALLWPLESPSSTVGLSLPATPRGWCLRPAPPGRGPGLGGVGRAPKLSRQNLGTLVWRHQNSQKNEFGGLGWRKESWEVGSWHPLAAASSE